MTQIYDALDILKSFDVAIDFIRKNWAHKNGDSGWAEFPLENGPIVPWGGTADGILSLLLQNDSAYSAEDNIKIEKSKQWLKTIRNVDDGWGEYSRYENHEKDFELNRSWTEATCWVLLALGKPQSAEEKKFIGCSLQWIINNQNAEGGWGYWKGRPSRIYSTCMALRVLMFFKIDNTDVIDQGIGWLLENISQNGGWGRYPKDENPTAAHTAHALLTLKSAKMSSNHAVIIKSKEILFSIKKNGAWENIIEENNFEDSGRKYRFRTRHFGTPWVLQALIQLDTYIFSNEILTGISILLDNQNQETGYWKFDSDTPPSIWSTFNCLMVLNSFYEKAQDFTTIVGIRGELISIKTDVANKLDSMANNLDDFDRKIDVKDMRQQKKYFVAMFIFVWSSIFISIMIFSGYYKLIPRWMIGTGLIVPILASIISSLIYDKVINRGAK